MGFGVWGLGLWGLGLARGGQSASLGFGFRAVSLMHIHAHDAICILLTWGMRISAPGQGGVQHLDLCVHALTR